MRLERRSSRARSTLNDDDLRLLWRKPDGRAVGGDAEARAEPIVRAAATPDAERDHDDDERDETNDDKTGKFSVLKSSRCVARRVCARGVVACGVDRPGEARHARVRRHVLVRCTQRGVARRVRARGVVVRGVGRPGGARLFVRRVR